VTTRQRGSLDGGELSVGQCDRASCGRSGASAYSQKQLPTRMPTAWHAWWLRPAAWIAAQVRGIGVEQLAMILLMVIIGDDLVTAILDDAHLLEAERAAA
jgi:hypothetical protein